MIHPLPGMALVLAGLGALLATATVLRRRERVSAELARKLVHIGMGLMTLSFPWLFCESWPVIALAALTVVALLVVRLMPAWRRRVGGALHDVARRSLGEIYFPASVAVVFVLARGEAILFVVPMLILTLADALAALVGVRYGAAHYTTMEGRKSTEGSVAFFVVAFLSAHVPLLLFTDVGRAESLLIGLTLGLLVMLLEAVAWRGLDNLFIPLGGFVLLKAYLAMGVTDLALRLGVTVALVVFVLGWRGRTVLNDSALLAAALAGYASWALGGWRWLAMPLMLFLVYLLLLTPRKVFGPERVHDVRAVVSATLPALLWLSLAGSLAHIDVFYLAALAHAAFLGMAALASAEHRFPAAPAWLRLGGAVLTGAGLFLPYFWVVEGMTLPGAWLMLTGAGLTAAAVLAFRTWQPAMHDCPVDTPRWWRQGGIAFLASLAGAIPLAWVK